jgi:hypothetical protein
MKENQRTKKKENHTLKNLKNERKERTKNHKKYYKFKKPRMRTKKNQK